MSRGEEVQRHRNLLWVGADRLVDIVRAKEVARARWEVAFGEEL
jgi:hypothetical protein